MLVVEEETGACGQRRIRNRSRGQRGLRIIGDQEKTSSQWQMAARLEEHAISLVATIHLQLLFTPVGVPLLVKAGPLFYPNSTYFL